MNLVRCVTKKIIFRLPYFFNLKINKKSNSLYKGGHKFKVLFDFEVEKNQTVLIMSCTRSGFILAPQISSNSSSQEFKQKLSSF